MKHDSPLTPEERKLYEWCLEVLDEDQLAELDSEAETFAAAEFYAPKAAEEILPLLVKLKLYQLEKDAKASDEPSA